MESTAPRPQRLRPTDVLKHEHRQIEERLERLSEVLRAVGHRGGELGGPTLEVVAGRPLPWEADS